VKGLIWVTYSWIEVTKYAKSKSNPRIVVTCLGIYFINFLKSYLNLRVTTSLSAVTPKTTNLADQHH